MKYLAHYAELHIHELKGYLWNKVRDNKNKTNKAFDIILHESKGLPWMILPLKQKQGICVHDISIQANIWNLFECYKC